MSGSKPVIVEAEPPHFAAIVRIEREGAAGSLVALTEGHALAEAMQRGHHVAVALIDGEVAGWVWFGASLARGGEEIGQVYRVAVTASMSTWKSASCAMTRCASSRPLSNVAAGWPWSL